MPTEAMRNSIIAFGIPGTAGMLDELLRRAASGQLPADETPQPETASESTQYQVVGDWGTESADDAEEARAAVASWLHDHPHSGARAEQRIVREWPDGSEFYGPWTDLPAVPAVVAQPDGEA